MPPETTPRRQNKPVEFPHLRLVASIQHPSQYMQPGTWTLPLRDSKPKIIVLVVTCSPFNLDYKQAYQYNLSRCSDQVNFSTLQQILNHAPSLNPYLCQLISPISALLFTGRLSDFTQVLLVYWLFQDKPSTCRNTFIEFVDLRGAVFSYYSCRRSVHPISRMALCSSWKYMLDLDFEGQFLLFVSFPPYYFIF